MLAKSVDRFGLSREAETYELVLALSAFTRRPRSPLDTIAISIVLPPPPLPFPRDPLCPGLIYVSTPSTLPTRWHTPIPRRDIRVTPATIE